MSTPPASPPERHTLYPEAHRAGDWTEPRKRRSILPVVIGVVVLVAAIVVTVQVGFGFGKSRGTASVEVTDPDGTTINAIQVEPGTCLIHIPENGDVPRVTAVPCNVPHHGEVVFASTLVGDMWPGTASVQEHVIDECGAFIQPSFDADAMFKPGDWEDGLRWVAWLPTEASWASGERDGYCVVYRQHEIVGSFVTGTATFSN
jgi:hypothetical protein